MGIVFDILFNSIGSIFLGLLLTFVIVGLIYWLVQALSSNNSTFSPVGYFAGGLLFFFLAFQMILICGAFTVKSYVDNVEETINGFVAALPQDEILTDGENQNIMDHVVEEYPLVGNYIDTAKLSGQTASDFAHATASALRASINSYILRRAGWSLLFILLSTTCMAMTMKRAYRSTRRAPHHGPASNYSGRISRRRG
ncbi:MAG: hypothetical protein Q4E59_06010 [Bacteroidales bacterium]|nr:hypothetical protein [Bacteroidales bacterium]